MNDFGRGQFVEFGGEGKALHLYHANGFPPRTYAPFVKELASYNVFAWEGPMLRRDISPTNFQAWQELADDLAFGLEARGQGAVFAAGHSLGGSVSAYLAVRRPLLVEKLVLIDPVILPPDAGRFVPESFDSPLAAKAKKRRDVWASKEEMREAYQGKSLFRSWSPESFDAYIDAALQASDGGYTLRYSREWEGMLYNTPPLAIWDVVEKITAPTLVIRASRSDVFFEGSAKALCERIPNAVECVLEGDHFLPMSASQRCAEVISEFLE